MGEKGAAPFVARARLLLLLGNQLITDEIAAISELVKNSYDADATHVKIILDNVSRLKEGKIVIWDNGNGMTRQNLVTSWLELGTISKFRNSNEPPRFSNRFKRAYLGEKGLGRLSIHKLGKKTEIITRAIKERLENRLLVDWTLFEDREKFLDDVKVTWGEDSPKTFVDKSHYGSHGTLISISNQHRAWTRDMIKRLRLFVFSVRSPFSDFTNFDIELEIHDELDEELNYRDIKELLATAHYVFSASVDKNGNAKMKYKFNLTNVEKSLKRSEEINRNILRPPRFIQERKSVCGPFNFQIFCWDLDPKIKKKTFEGAEYDQLIRPQSGVKLFRDGFRVLPYGNEDNDWLNMDKQRIERFQENVSRNQLIAYVEISSKNNPLLIDKSDREGLIDNDAFRDFKALLGAALDTFQNERNTDREKMKMSKTNDSRTRKFYDDIDDIYMPLIKNASIEDRLDIIQKTKKMKKSLERLIRDIEEPLLTAASIGLTYMIPTHEIRRDIQETIKILKSVIDRSTLSQKSEQIHTAIKFLRQADEMIRGIVKISQRVQDEGAFELSKPIESAIYLMNNKINRNHIQITRQYNINTKIRGSERLLAIMFVNMIDNSIFWLGRNKNDNRKLKFMTAPFQDNFAIIISDNGPGIEDDIDKITMPFVTTKENGMGLGLFISNKIARAHGAELKLFSKNEIEGLLPGANIGILFRKKSSN